MFCSISFKSKCYILNIEFNRIHSCPFGAYYTISTLSLSNLECRGFPLSANFNHACLLRCLGGHCVTLRHDCKGDHTIAPWTQLSNHSKRMFSIRVVSGPYGKCSLTGSRCGSSWVVDQWCVPRVLHPNQYFSFLSTLQEILAGQKDFPTDLAFQSKNSRITPVSTSPFPRQVAELNVNTITRRNDALTE